jgi:hypothetical protein
MGTEGETRMSDVQSYDDVGQFSRFDLHVHSCRAAAANSSASERSRNLAGKNFLQSFLLYKIDSQVWSRVRNYKKTCKGVTPPTHTT